MILQRPESISNDNRRSFDVDYDSYEYYDDYDYDDYNQYVDPNIYDDGKETLSENYFVQTSVKENISNTDFPDEVFSNVMYAMASETAAINTVFDDSEELLEFNDSEANNVSELEIGESLDSIVALPLVKINESGQTDDDENNQNEEKSVEDTQTFNFYQAESFGPEADQILGENMRTFKKPFANQIHMDVQHYLHLKK